MCKIIAASGNPDKLTLEKKINLEKFLRGLLLACNYDMHDDDATGMFTMRNGQYTFVKKPGEVRDFIDGTPEWVYATLEMPQEKYLFHCRGAMSNPEINENNHPFVGKNVALAHEGWIDGHIEKAKTLNLSLSTSTDSELFMRFLDDRFNNSDEIINLTCEAIHEIANAPSSIAFVHLPTGKLMFIRNAMAEHHYFVWESYYFNYRFLIPSEYVLAAGLVYAFETDRVKRVGSRIETKPFVAYEI